MKRWITNILLVVFIAVFVISSGFLVKYFLESHQQQDAFNNLADIMNSATTPSTPAQSADPDAPVSTTPDGEEIPVTISPYVQVENPNNGEMVEMFPEFAELYAMNSDLIGWITIEDTSINYPVLQSLHSKDYYLRRNFYGEHSNHGSIYAQESCDVFHPSDNVVIFGHRMSDGTMFYDLLKYAKKSFWEDHQYITFNTLREKHTYQVCYVFKIASGLDTPFPYHQFVNALDAGEFDQYIDNCTAYQLYDTGIVPTYGDKLITLSTCEYSQVNGRMVIVAVRID